MMLLPRWVVASELRSKLWFVRLEGAHEKLDNVSPRIQQITALNVIPWLHVKLKYLFNVNPQSKHSQYIAIYE